MVDCVCVNNKENCQDLKKNEAQYREDYQWYTNTLCENKDGSIKCQAGNIVDKHNLEQFNIKEDKLEKLLSRQNYPTEIRKIINDSDIIEDKIQYAIDTKISFEKNGEIKCNTYYVNWYRMKDDIIHFDVFYIDFSRKAGDNYRFDSEYLSGQIDRIKNAKKYSVLKSIEENPVIENFYLKSMKPKDDVPKLTDKKNEL
ncbi:unnamed protein product [Didymodactylos carnosus]|uniref:Uncharacterized protein n=1 Tax=Didymodactylos carnosus TaxID=1234261 RepID=A0A814XWS6_9BILA|nr:unnamed protein product [Didymodactylos carnosus]CAF3984576.1 unnamed protein product [Didymodactylos carnosus]